MVYCNLKGGLGNMLFQIATTISLATEKNIEFSFPNLHNHLDYLNHDNTYNPKIKHATEYMEIFGNFNSIQPTTQIKKYTYPFNFIELNIDTDDFYIDGFFQSEKYFIKHSSEILKILGVPNSIRDIITDKYGYLLSKRLTSIHVRRGDYIRFQNHHPVQSLEYYTNSVKLLSDNTDIYVVFSDDIEWCKENFNDINNIVYIENEKDYIELYLMSLCDNNITSNSSFSWWGAWLNNNENKIVIGPKIWFGDAIKNNTGDLLPENWIKI